MIHDSGPRLFSTHTNQREALAIYLDRRFDSGPIGFYRDEEEALSPRYWRLLIADLLGVNRTAVNYRNLREKKRHRSHTFLIV